MHREEVRRRVSKTLKRIGHKPPLQGGNGRGLTRAQGELYLRLAEHGFIPELVVITRMGRLGYPHHYKIDIADPSRMVAIEVDGGSHGSMKVQESDRKKDAFLIACGWRVFRFSNQVAMERTEECVRTVLSTT